MVIFQFQIFNHTLMFHPSRIPHYVITMYVEMCLKYAKQIFRKYEDSLFDTYLFSLVALQLQRLQLPINTKTSTSAKKIWRTNSCTLKPRVTFLRITSYKVPKYFNSALYIADNSYLNKISVDFFQQSEVIIKLRKKLSQFFQKF